MIREMSSIADPNPDAGDNEEGEIKLIFWFRKSVKYVEILLNNY